MTSNLYFFYCGGKLGIDWAILCQAVCSHWPMGAVIAAVCYETRLLIGCCLSRGTPVVGDKKRV